MSYFNVDANGNIEDITVVLCHRNKTVIGTLYPVFEYSTKDPLNGAHEISFSFYRYVNGEVNKFYDMLKDLQLVYIPEKEMYYEINITEEENEQGTLKKVTGIDLGTAELSQTILRDLEFNTELDIERDDYRPAKIYDINDIANSILPRILSKTPSYTISHVDDSIANLQRTFSINDTSTIDFLRGEFADELNCVVEVDSIARAVKVYDLETYGKNTNIVASLANISDSITINTNKDSVKNCFYVSGGDDLVTNTIPSINPNGTNYVWNFSNEMLADMPKELVDKINKYNELYEEKKPDYEKITKEIYKLYGDIDLIKYGQVDKPGNNNTCKDELDKVIDKLEEEEGNTISVSESALGSPTSVNNAIKSFCKIFLDPGFQLDLKDASYDISSHKWTGKFRVSRTSNDEVYADSDKPITITIDSNYTKFLEQKMSKTLAQYNLQNNKKEPIWKDYPLSILSSYESAYDTCLSILQEQGVAKAGNETYGVYETYYKWHEDIVNQIKEFEQSIATLEEQLKQAKKEQAKIQNELNFETYVGTELWQLLSCYRREDSYNNSNYVSDGLEDTDLLNKCTELFERASEELYKASQVQYEISANIKNFLMMDEFKDIYKYCELGNWIYVQTTYDDVYKLRIIEINVSDTNLTDIDITFSNVVKVKNGYTDFESILSQAQNMATSYESVKRQASTGEEAADSIMDWLDEGLNTSLMTLKNNTDEEVVIDSAGITCKTYDDITETYNPKQLRITHNVLVYTDDNFATAKMSIGESTYHKYVDNNEAKIDSFDKFEGYGQNSDFMTAGYIAGSQIIGGDIYSYKPTSSSDGYNYSKYAKTGSHIDLVHSEFEFYGNGSGTSLVYRHDNDKGILEMKKGTIIAGDIYSENETTTHIDLNHGSFSFADGALTYNYPYNEKEQDNYMTFSKGGFVVKREDEKTKQLVTVGIFDGKGIDLRNDSHNHIGNFFIGTEGLTLDMGYDFNNREITQNSDFNKLQILYDSDFRHQSTIRFRTPLKDAVLSGFGYQTELWYDGIRISKIQLKEDGTEYIVPTDENLLVSLSHDKLSLGNEIEVNAKGFRAGDIVISESNGIEISSPASILLKVTNNNNTKMLEIEQTKVTANTDWTWWDGSINLFSGNLYLKDSQGKGGKIFDKNNNDIVSFATNGNTAYNDISNRINGILTNFEQRISALESTTPTGGQ